MAAKPMANNAGSQQQQNATLRAIFLQTAVRSRKNLGAFTGALGQTTRIKLFNVGVLTSLSILVTCPVTIAVAVAVPSQKAPYNLINRISILDYDGTARIQISGLQLYILNSVIARQPYGYNNQQAAQAGAGIVTNPSVPTAIANGTIQFYLQVPICLDDNRWHGLAQDLSGAIYAQTGVGDLYLAIDWNSTLVANNNIEAVYAGAGTTTVVLNGVTGPSVQVWQKYFMPQPVGQQGQLPLPMLDLTTVYELNGNLRTADNIVANAEKLINIPNVRKVIGVYVSFVNGAGLAILGTTDLTLLRMIVNGNNVLEEWSQIAQQVEQRVVTEGDVLPGTYYWSYRDKPIYTAIYGNVQIGFTPNTVAGTPYFELMFESFYTKGSNLPGMTQTS